MERLHKEFFVGSFDLFLNAVLTVEHFVAFPGELQVGWKFSAQLTELVVACASILAFLGPGCLVSKRALMCVQTRYV